MGFLGYWGRGGGKTGRRTVKRPAKRFRRLSVPEPLEDRALPGGSLLELLLGAPLLSPFLDSSWADGGPSPSDDVPGPEARARNRTSALHELLANPHALEQTVAEVRNLVEIASTQAQAADAQKDAFPGSEREGTGASAGDSPGLKPWWDDPGWLAELEAVLRELARAGSRLEFDSLGGPVLEQPGDPEVPPTEPGDPLFAGDFPGELPVEGDPGGGGGMATLDYGGGGYGGGGYGGNHAPVAVNDQAYCGIDAAVVLFVLGNDRDPDGDDYSVTAVSHPEHGTAEIGYLGGSVIYTPNPGYTSGNDTFQYTVADEHGASAQATVTVSRVQVTAFTVKRQLDDLSWTEVFDGEHSWSHDKLQWTAAYAPAGTPGLTMATWWKKAWTAPDQPANWSEFTARIVQPAEGNPLMGDWAIRPNLCFTPPGQTPFWVKLATPKHRVDAQISGIRWETHSNPATAGELLLGCSGWRFYPDAPAPGGGFHPDVDVVATVSPPLPQVQVVMQWYDVDDPSDHDGPIDTMDPPAENPGYNEPDNKPTADFPEQQISLSAPSAPNAQGEVRAELRFVWMQPGNNVRVAVAGRAEELAPIKPLAPDDRTCLLFDKNGDNNYRTGDGDYTLAEWSPSPSVHVTQTLTVWRELHVEVDSMGRVTGNRTDTTPTDVRGNLDNTATVFLGAPVEGNNRYERGLLCDSIGESYSIKGNSATEVTVYKGAGGKVPNIENGWVRIEDDDWRRFPNNQDIPMPDCTGLGDAMAQAYVQVMFDVGDHDDEVPFVVNVPDSNAGLVAAQRWNSVGLNTTAFWVGYVLGGFQLDPQKDFDPDGEQAAFGNTPRDDSGGSIVHLETLRDYADVRGLNRTAFERDTVVHEVGHQFRKHSEPVITTDDPAYEGPCRYLEPYLLQIRTVDKPASRPG